MEEYLISIIVPAYNIENYIGRCLESIQHQSYRNLEILVVNDGSSDSTGEVIDRYAANDTRIRPIHKKNGGVSRARLEGVKRAQGEYIGFVDGDDYIEADMYTRLLKNMMKYDADISHCGYQMIFPDGHADYYYNTGRIAEQDGETGLSDLLDGSFIEPGLCNKLFHKSLLQSLLHENKLDLSIKNNEDLLMNYYLFSKAKKSVYEDICPYHYILRKNSAATSKISVKKMEDPVIVWEKILSDLANKDQQYDVAMQRYLCVLANNILYQEKRKSIEVKKFQKLCQKKLRFMIGKKETIDAVKNIKTCMLVYGVAYIPGVMSGVKKMYQIIKGSYNKYSME